MALSRHKHVLRSRTPLHRRRLIRYGLPVGAVLALANPAAGLVWPDEPPVRATPVATTAEVSVRPSAVPMRVAPISRSQERVRLVPKPPVATAQKFATTALDARAQPADNAPVLKVLQWAEQVGVTGKVQGPWAEVVLGTRSAWVHRAYLSDTKPQPTPTPTPTPTPKPTPTQAPPSATAAPATTALSTAACASGSAMESGLSQNAIAVHRAVCAAFPQVTNYGGVRNGDGGDHGSGHAVDIMIPDSATGDRIAEWVRAHASELGVTYVIWSQHIWSVQRSSEGWRPMEDRGSATANHYDHVHVSVS